MDTIIVDFKKKYNERKIIKYQLAYYKIIALGDMAENVYAKVKALLGEDDPITERMYVGMSNIVDDAGIMIEKVIEEEKPLKPIQQLKIIIE